MYTELGTETLKSGELATIARVQAPDTDWGERIVPFLAHKERVTRWQIQETVMGDLGRLESYYYIAHLDGEVISNIATWEYLGSGILGHVYTAPEHRRKGAAKAVMARQMEDFRNREGSALFLGTGYDTVPYYIYKEFGFESVEPGSGFMHYYADSEETFERDYFAPGPTAVREMGWHDWAGLVTLLGCSKGPGLRMIASGHIGRRNFEGAFIDFLHDVKEQGSSQGWVLEVSGGGSVVGVVRLSPDPRFGGAVHTFDLYVHPAFEDDGIKLLDAVDWPAFTKFQAYVGSDDSGKIELLTSAGFGIEGLLRNQLRERSQSIDVTILGRAGA